jgi:hypothetical protein
VDYYRERLAEGTTQPLPCTRLEMTRAAERRERDRLAAQPEFRGLCAVHRYPNGLVFYQYGNLLTTRLRDDNWLRAKEMFPAVV